MERRGGGGSGDNDGVVQIARRHLEAANYEKSYESAVKRLIVVVHHV